MAGAIFMNVYIRFTLESYLELCLSSMLRLQMLEFGIISSSFHSSLSIGILALVAIFPVSAGAYLVCRKKQVKSEKFQKRFGELVLGLKLEKQSALLYPVLFMTRRLIYAVILIKCLNRSVYQLQLIIVKSFAFMIYIGRVRPYEVRLSNIVELTNEVIISLCAYWLVTFSDFVPDEKTKYKCGWPIIGATSLLVLFNLGVICYSTVANIVYRCKLYCRRRTAI